MWQYKRKNKRVMPPTSRPAKDVTGRTFRKTNALPGVINKFMLESLATPYGAKANCYAHFLGLKSGIDKTGRMMKGGLTNRNSKSQPGESCAKASSKMPLQFHNRKVASGQIIDRVRCDNPDKVLYINPPYTQAVLTFQLPRGWHMGCAIVGGSDYHFLRREGIEVLMNSPLLSPVLSNNVKKQLALALQNGHRYVWSHVAGWSGRMKLVDARGKIILNPVPFKAKGVELKSMPTHDRAHHDYPSLDYDTFVGFFMVKSRSATVNTRSGKPVNIGTMTKRLLELGVPSQIIKQRLQNMY